MPAYEKNPDIFDRVMDKIDKLPELLMPFLKKYAWVGGILLIILGVYKAISVLVSLFVIGSNFGNLGGAVTSFALPMYVTYAFNILLGIALIVIGSLIIKKFKHK